MCGSISNPGGLIGRAEIKSSFALTVFITALTLILKRTLEHAFVSGVLKRPDLPKLFSLCVGEATLRYLGNTPGI